MDDRGLRLDGVCAGYPARRGHRGRLVLDGLDATAAPGELTVLIGPNGAGKSTLLRTMAGLQPVLDGRVLIDGAAIESVPASELARRLAVVLTERDLPALLTARELAGLGRHPHTGFTGRLSAADGEIVSWALEAVHAVHLADRPVTELSDGERQRVLVARALAQQPSAILLDEPTAFLDVTSRVALMGLLRRLARENDLAVVVSTHDLELALRVADRLWLLAPGGLLSAGTPEELTLRGVIGAAFDGDELSFDPASGVFVLQAGSGGRVRVTADGIHRPLLERALAREGWRTAAVRRTGEAAVRSARCDAGADAGAGPGPDGEAVELAVRRTGNGYVAAFDGEVIRFATIPELAAWSRHAADTLRETPPTLRPATPLAVSGAVCDVSTVGGYFELGIGEVEDGWRPLTDLFTDPGVLEKRIADVAERLNTTETRVAASILFQGIAARIWSPPLGAAIAHGLLIDLDPGRIHWQAAPSGPLPLRATGLDGWQVRDPERITERLHHTVVTGLLEPLTAAFRTVVKIAPGLLWGNAASALAGAVRAIARVRPELNDTAVTLGRELLDLGPLRDTGELAEPAPGHPFFVRRSCCLYYRLPGGGKCGDCALIAPGTRHAQWARAVRESQGAR
ncbi:(2Fe-2S)-binding protein [Microtetraspora sp. AC03309]|uniref:ATP-binding cassette domain-containing protein n=1 Tax=Microtetraspora sp. AC03309 TaxID=2779376 RepID=UPI001E2B1439|nr:ATP-binding cassette domain-containing protein [Microtetraspora sp. AC03309]MCC5575300.1 (2Fe-2S)-binding protein [Microtetraspora sp. AC03309]